MKASTVIVGPQELPSACAEAVRNQGRFVTMIASDEKETGLDRFVVRYLFAYSEKKELSEVKAVIPESNPVFASVSSTLPAASFAEREAHDLFGIQPVGHPDLRALVLHEHWPDGVYPLRKEYPLAEMPNRDPSRSFSYPKVEGEGVFEVPVGPIHAGVIEPGHFRFQVMGDSVLHLEAKLFYTHRGIEKRSENMTLKKGLFLAERICGVCSVSHALSYAQAVEGIAGTEITEKTKFLRVMFAELERLYNHVGDIGNMCAGIGYSYGINRGASLKEQLMQMNDFVAGHRFLRGMVTLGGVARDVTGETLRHIQETVREVFADLREMVDHILSNDVVINRFTGTGVLTKRIVRDFSAVGPTARSTDYDVDVRRDLPYAAYPQLTFQVPLLTDGDVLARFKLRFLEAEQSVNLIEQVIGSMPDGPIQVAVENVPAYSSGYGITESARGENVHFVMTGRDHTIYRYRVRSASYANWPVVPASVPGNLISDFPLINKSYELCYACCDR